MPKFRKKPVVIEASQWFKYGDHPMVDKYLSEVSDSARACRHCGKSKSYHGHIQTLEGGHIVCPGDWIIKGVKGEFYPCKPGIFEQTYDAVNEE